jgi:peptidoglycan/xylan/chitin deacetylase (PgdA/CDA1 family)
LPWWRWPLSLVDPAVPRTQAVRRLRALVLASVATLSLAALSTAGAAPAVPAGEGTGATGTVAPDRSTTSAPTPATASTTTTSATVPTTTTSATVPSTTTTTPPTTTTTTVPPTTTTTTVPSVAAESISGLARPGEAPILTRVETSDPVVFVTIDDGNVRSADAAAAIAELGIPVSLFLVNGPISAGADYFAGLPGAIVESHTRTHPDLRTLPLAGQRREICGNAETIAGAFGRYPTLFRPPYGNYDGNTPRAAADCGMVAIVLWEVVVDHGRVRHRTVAQLRPGDIVLFHFEDGLGDSLRMFAQQAQAAGLRIARLEDYLVP